jgi:hypothetical protein
MSIKTEYKCDRCGVAQATAVQFWEVGVTANCIDATFKNDSFVCGKRMQVCRTCLEILGIHTQKREPDAPAPPTIEELILEIVNNAMAERYDR